MNISFWQFFRLIFVVFSLYLLGDAFSRWDGFSYYASFLEFLPSVALASILWSIVSLCAAIFLWMLLRACEGFFGLIGLKIRIEHLLFYACFFAISGVLAWKGKKFIWPYFETTLQIKILVFLCVSLLSISTSWVFREKAGQWTEIVLRRITPLVWLFGILVLLAVPLVSCQTWLVSADKHEKQRSDHNVSVDRNGPNIILVTFDALAAREMSAYGYHRETTPFINKWSKSATVFSKVEAGSNFTTPAAASLMTGKRVWTHQTFHIAGTKPKRSEVESLPAVLKEHGYFNMAFVVNPFASVNVLGMSGSFDMATLTSEFGSSDSLFGWKFGIVDKMLYRLFGDKIRLHNWIIRNDFILSKLINVISRNISHTTVPPEKAFNAFLDVIDNNRPQPFFAWIHLFPPHDPYLPPEALRTGGNASTELRTYKNQEALIEESYTYLFQNLPFPDDMQPAVDLMRGYYDEFVMYIDKEFKGFILELNKRDMGNTVIILSADHGESFDHGYFTHGGPFLYEQVTHVPLIIKEPDQEKGRIVETLVEQIDIPATILALANIQIPFWMEGRSLTPLMQNGELPQRPAFSMNFEGNRSRGHKIAGGSIAVWKGDYKLIHFLERKESLLFNLKDDPEETRDLNEKEPEIRLKLLNLLNENLEMANKKIIAD